MEIWGGIECTINRVGNAYHDQLEFSGHYQRDEDLRLICDLGIKALRYPVLWEKHQPTANHAITWQVEKQLNYLKERGVEVIAGLVHHGSGPSFASIEEDAFAENLAVYAGKVATKFPWIENYTPVNEPLTTARFCGLYGIWYPHEKSNLSFFKILISECRATILAMEAIRKVNPRAKLVFTEDIAKVHSTTSLKEQATYENHRRWLSLDLIMGKVNQSHYFWPLMIAAGVKEQSLQFFLDHAMVPSVLGFNYYVTSERFLDENTAAYPEHLHGGNDKINYVDIEAVRTDQVQLAGLSNLLEEAWDRYHVEIAVTEAHLHCTRDEQLRWLQHIHKELLQASNNGIPIKAMTIWSLTGAYGWDTLLVNGKGTYEAGAFDSCNGRLRPTALTKQITSFVNGQKFEHPALATKGWWELPGRILYGNQVGNSISIKSNLKGCRPLLIIGADEALGQAIARVCVQRGISYQLPGNNELDLTAPLDVEEYLEHYRPWAVIYAIDFADTDRAERFPNECFSINTETPLMLAHLCKKVNAQFVAFSSYQVFDGKTIKGYTEYDAVNPLNVYGKSKVTMERELAFNYPNALILRTGTLFSPWDDQGPLAQALRQMQAYQKVMVDNCTTISLTYVPDLINTCLNLLIDEESGIWHLSNRGATSYADFLENAGTRAGLDVNLIISAEGGSHSPLNYELRSTRGDFMPALSQALDHYFDQVNMEMKAEVMLIS